MNCINIKKKNVFPILELFCKILLISQIYKKYIKIKTTEMIPESIVFI